MDLQHLVAYDNQDFSTTINNSVLMKADYVKTGVQGIVEAFKNINGYMKMEVSNTQKK